MVLLTITGTNFAPGNGVNFGNLPALVVTLVNSTTLTATSPALPAGTVDVTVTVNGVISARTAADQFTYEKQTPVIDTLPTASAITYGQTLAASTLTGGIAKLNGSVVPGVFTWTASSTTPNSGTPSEGITFTPTDSANYNTATGSVSVVVGKATLVIATLPTASAITYGQTLSSSTLSGGSAKVNGTGIKPDVGDHNLWSAVHLDTPNALIASTPFFGETTGGIVNGLNSAFPSASGVQSNAEGTALQVGGGAELTISCHLALRLAQAH